jgi:hypothetical protein
VAGNQAFARNDFLYTNPSMNWHTKRRIGIRRDGGGGRSAEPPGNTSEKPGVGSSADSY